MADWPLPVLLNTSNDNIPRRPGGTPTTSATATATTTTTTYYDNVYVSVGGRWANRKHKRKVKTGGASSSVPEEFLVSGRCIGDDESLGKYLVIQDVCG